MKPRRETVLGLLLTSFLVVNPLDFSWKECLQSTPQECAKSLLEFSGQEVDDFLRPLCMKDNINQACLTLGHFLNLQKKHKESAEVLAQACSFNLGDACVEAGYALERLGDEKKSSDLFLYGCLSLKHPASCQALAVNEREARRFQESYRLFLRSCDLGSVNGCLGAADASIFAKMNTDYNLLQIYKKACDLDSGIGCIKVGEFFKEKKDFSQSSEFFKKACLLEEPEACALFKEVHGGYMHKTMEYLKQSLSRFMEWFLPLEKRL